MERARDGMNSHLYLLTNFFTFPSSHICLGSALFDADGFAKDSLNFALSLVNQTKHESTRIEESQIIIQSGVK